MVSASRWRARSSARGSRSPQLGLPVPPVAGVMFVVQRAEQGVVVEPPALALGERLEIRGARRSRREPFAKHVKGEVKGDTLQRTNGAKVDGRAPARLLEPRAIGRVERCLAAGGGELLHVAERNEHRIDSHRAQGGVRRILPFLHFVDRQQLHQVQPGRRQPARELRQIGDLANAPARSRRNGEERNEHAGVPADGERCRQPSTRSSTARTPAANGPGSGNRLTIKKRFARESRRRIPDRRRRRRVRAGRASSLLRWS